MTVKYHQQRIELIDQDYDFVLAWPQGQEMTIQVRRSGADVGVGGYEGSLDIILPVAKPKHLSIAMHRNWYTKEEK